MRNDFYTFAKASNNTWKGYGPGCVTTFAGEAAEAMNAALVQWLRDNGRIEEEED